MLLGHYPEHLRKLISITSSDFHIPSEIIALNILPAISGAINHNVSIDAPWGKISPSVFTLTLIGSGGRKSSLQSFLFKPHREHQKQKISFYEQKMKAFSRDIENSSWSKAEKEENRPKDPRLILTSGTTIQKMIQEMATREPAGFVSIMDEVMSFFAGYSGKEMRIQTGSLITGLWGATAETGSMSNGVLSAYGKHLAVSWFGQPAPIHEYLSDQYLRMQGVLSRFFMIERSYPLMHNSEITVYNSSIYDSYKKRLKFLLSQEQERNLTISKMGKSCLDSAIENIFSSNYDGGSIESQFISRYQEHVLRTAACLHVFENDGNEISTDTIIQTCKLVDKIFNEWKKVILPGNKNIFEQSVEKVEQWVNGRNEFTELQIQKSNLKLKVGLKIDLSNKYNNRQKLLEELQKSGRVIFDERRKIYKVQEVKKTKEEQRSNTVESVVNYLPTGLRENYDEVDRRPDDPILLDAEFFGEHTLIPSPQQQKNANIKKLKDEGF